MNITPLFFEFRAICAHVWNSCFLPRIKLLKSSEYIDDFYAIYDLLFITIVLSAIPSKNANLISPPRIDAKRKNEFEIRNEANHKSVHLEYRVIPRSKIITCIISEKNVGNWTMYDKLNLEGVDMRLVGLFDWDEFGERKFEYLRVKIISCDLKGSNNFSLTGREALLNFGDCDIFYIENEPQS